MHEQFHTLFTTAITNKGLTNLQVAELLGFGNANVISMIKTGRMQLPEDKLLATSTHLDIPPSDLLHAWCHARGCTDILVLSQQDKGTSQLNDAEMNWLAIYRSAFNDQAGDLAHDASSSPPELYQALLLLAKGIAKLHQSSSTKE